MKQKEWERRRKLDLEGVSLLGAALSLRAARMRVRYLELAEKQRNAQKSARRLNPFEFPHELEAHEQQVIRYEQEQTELDWRLSLLGIETGNYSDAGNLLVQDFRFRWDQLRQHGVLVGYITEDLPDYAKGWGKEQPISRQEDGRLTTALISIFEFEFDRLNSLHPDDVPELRSEEDFEFYLLVWRLCEPAHGKGHPKGRRWNDGRERAASYAYSLRSEAADKGEPISTDEAIRRSLSKFTVVSSGEFEQVPDKSAVVVSNAGSGSERFEGALKSVRRMLSDWDNSEISE